MNILKPIEALLLLIFEGSFRLTGNYGASLLVMSLVITVGTYPLYALADAWKKKEDDIQRLMEGDISKIKAAFSGNKRFYLIQTAYRLHGYRPWYAFRSAAGLLIQIPFFFAAYNVLSAYTGYAGHSFLAVKDLARPDAMLWGANLLPFLMTAVNIASSALYTRSLRVRDNLQLLVMAAVFFILLYGQPSALLVYWTSNNVLSLVKSLIRKRDGSAWKLPDRSECRQEWLLLKVTLVWASFCIHLYLLKNIGLHTLARNISLSVLLLVSLALLLKEKSLLLFIRRYFPAYLFILCMYVIHKKDINLSFFRGSTAMALIMLGLHYLVLSLALSTGRVHKDEGDTGRTGTGNERRRVAVDLFLFLATFAVLLPQEIYVKDPAEVNIPYLSILGGNLILFAAAYLPLLFLIGRLGQKGLRRSSLALTAFALAYMFNAVLFPLDAGVLNGFTFISSAQFVFQNFTYLLKDIGIGLFLLSLLSLIIGTCRMSDTGEPLTASDASTGLDESVRGKHSFSRTGKNILYVCLDMFNSVYIDRIRSELPEFDKKFAGFTWYADTLSVSGWTTTSLPSLYGGGGYTPIKNNENGISVDDAGKLALAELKENVEAAGLRFSFVDDIGQNGESQYYRYYMDRKSIPMDKRISKRRLLLMLPIFGASPYVFKQYIYNEGFWLVYGERLYLAFNRENALKSLSYLDLLPELSSADSPRGNFLYFRSELSHAPFGINSDGNVIDGDYPDPENKIFDSPTSAYYSAKKCMTELADYFDWMRENGVYDNTLIVICSDHGNSVGDNDIPVSNPGDSSERIRKSRANALFMIKPLGNDDGFVVDRDSSKSNGDIVASIFDGMGLEHNFQYHTEGGTRYYSFMLGRSEKRMRYVTYRVNGNIFSPTSWEKQ